MSSEHQGFADKLKTARRVAAAAENPAMAAKEGVKAAFNLAKLTAYIDPFMDWLFGIALIFAFIKDVLDIPDDALVAAGGVGEILIIITTTVCSMAIAAIMFITGSSGKTKMARAMIKKVLLLITATIIECIPAIDVLPIESLVVAIVFWMTLVDRKVAAQQEKKEQKIANKNPDALPA